MSGNYYASFKISDAAVKREKMRVPYNSPILKEDLSGKLLQFTNCRTLRGLKLTDLDVWVEDGRIVDAAVVFYDERRVADIQVDCMGLILAPGLIDIQINGGFGIDFSSVPSEEFVEKLNFFANRLLEYGVTAFCPTIITSQPSVYHSILPLVGEVKAKSRGAVVIGAHVEGPFISVLKKGAHPTQNVKGTFEPNAAATIEEMYGSTENIAILTLAPELPGALDAINYLRKRGVIVSIGHSSGRLVDGEKAINAGASAITHLFNAMPSYHHRDPGLIGLLTSKYLPPSRPLYYGIISDGIHTHDSALRIAYKTHPDGLVLITDAIAAFGMGDGTHRLGEQVIHCHGLSAIVADTNTTAGSVASLGFCVRHFVKAARCSLEEALDSATAKPAKLLGIERDRGTLAVGAIADLVLIDDDVNVFATYLSSRLVHVAHSA